MPVRGAKNFRPERKRMVKFVSPIKKFGQQGEKTGWSYLTIPQDIAEQLKPGTRTSFRVKGKLDAFAIEQVAILPMGDGSFILPLNQAIRKGIRKNANAMVTLQLAEDKKPLEISKELLDCLADEPAALANFNKLTPSHQRYYSKWVLSAKTEQTKTKRILRVVHAMIHNLSYGEMLRNS